MIFFLNELYVDLIGALDEELFGRKRYLEALERSNVK